MLGLLFGMASTWLCAQEQSDKLRLSGSLQSDILLPEKDKTCLLYTSDAADE